MIGFRLFSLLAAATFELEVVASEVEDVFQGIQDQRVHVVAGGVLFVVVLHRKDAAHLQSHIRTELLHLSDRDTKQEAIIADPIQLFGKRSYRDLENTACFCCSMRITQTDLPLQPAVLVDSF